MTLQFEFEFPLVCRLFNSVGELIYQLYPNLGWKAFEFCRSVLVNSVVVSAPCLLPMDVAASNQHVLGPAVN
jgi:hypothetical protein